MMNHFLSVADLDADELAQLLDDAARFKHEPEAARLSRAHAAVLLFERPSLRTRTAYEVAMMHLGGRAVTFETQLGQRETMADVVKTLSHLVSVIVARVRDHASLEALAAHAEVPVVNALSNREHPVEVLADALTMREQWGTTQGRRLAFIGDGNNICHSLLLLGSLLGVDVAVASPAGYAPAAEIVAQAQALADGHNTRIEVLTDPRKAAAGADAVYTDVWASMGQEESAEVRRQVFEPYQVTGELLSLAQPDAIVLHCLPARRGEEVTAEVLDGPQSLAFDRLSNLVPVTAAVLSWLLR
ncbi:MAG: ornithine carbamoyltransferase [Chloroflexi bacterium]|nr:ornithine carbamoyltransferase [Chloroflexota bacterium]